VLDVHRLRLLRELGQRGTIAAVADALGYSHSTVSQQLGQLERQSGTRLLERVGRGVRLAPAADVLVGHADAVLTRLEQAEADLVDLAAGAAGQLRIAMFPRAAHSLLPHTLDRLAPDRTAPRGHRQHPHRGAPGPPAAPHRARLLVDPLVLAVPPGVDGEGGLTAPTDSAWVLEPPGTVARLGPGTLPSGRLRAPGQVRVH
jgi:DNA-binding transcriptional LysR family regulator